MFKSVDYGNFNVVSGSRLSRYDCATRCHRKKKFHRCRDKLQFGVGCLVRRSIDQTVIDRVPSRHTSANRQERMQVEIAPRLLDQCIGGTGPLTMPNGISLH
jgi:hypothetical protein